MAEQFITCPKCKAEIPLTEALTETIRESLRVEIETKANKREQELQKKLQDLKKQEKALTEKEEAIEEEVTERVKAEKDLLSKEVYRKAKKELSAKTESLEQELDEKAKKIAEMQKQEIDLRKKQREVEQKQQELELENERRLDEERKKIEQQASKQAAEGYRLQMRQKDDLIKSMQNQIEELKRKAETGSQERQGEALEEELIELLERSFPYDTFEEIKRGQRGADILQKVRNKSGKLCGSILWESKNTKEFSKAWIDKLRTDQQRKNADIGVIMSVALPKEIESFDMCEGVWITNYGSAIGLARALRQSLIEVARQRLISAGQDSIKDVLYQYITGQEFAMHIKAVVNAFNRMQADLEREKRATLKTWKNREKQIQLVIQNVSEIYGSVEGYIGGKKQLPRIEPLSLDTSASEEEEEEV
jgi:hypothetical protein